MADCPVCGDPFEYRQVEEPDGGDGAGATIEVDDLVEADPGTRWNRVCPRAIPVEGDDGTPTVRLELFRHHWASTE